MKFQKGNEGKDQKASVHLTIKNIPKKLDEFLREYINQLDKSVSVENAHNIWVNMWENERNIMKQEFQENMLDEMNEIYDVFIDNIYNYTTIIEILEAFQNSPHPS